MQHAGLRNTNPALGGSTFRHLYYGQWWAFSLPGLTHLKRHPYFGFLIFLRARDKARKKKTTRKALSAAIPQFPPTPARPHLRWPPENWCNDVTPLFWFPRRCEYRKCGIRGGCTQKLWARGRASQVLTAEKLAGPDWGELWRRHLGVQSALVMEAQVAVAGAGETEAEADKGSMVGSARQESLVSAPKGAVRWKLLRQVRASARHRCLWPLPSQVADAPARLPVLYRPTPTSPFVRSQARSAPLLHLHRPTKKGRIWRGWRARFQKLSSK